MSQIPLDSKLPAVVAALQASEGINQRAELAAVIGSPTLATDAMAVQVAALELQKEALIAYNNAVDANNSTVKQNIVTALLTRGIAAVATDAWASLVGKINKSVNCVAGNIKSGVTIDGITGTANNISPGALVVATNNSSINGTESAMTKKREYQINFNGGVRVIFTMTPNGSGPIINGRVYKNGIAIGTMRNISSGATGATYSEDFTGIVAGDLIQIYMNCTNGGTYYLNSSSISITEAPVTPTL